MKKLSITAMMLLFIFISGCAQQQGISTISEDPAKSQPTTPPETVFSSSLNESSQAEPALESTPKPTPTPSPQPDPDELVRTAAREILSSMTLEEKIQQMFMLRLPYHLKDAGDEAAAYTKNTNAGGYVLFDTNISSRSNTRAFVECLNESSQIPPFIAIDEEGGIVSRLSTAGLEEYTAPISAKEIGLAGDSQNAYNWAAYIGDTLTELGVNVDFAPVADILTNPGNYAIGSRAFGTEADIVSDMVSAFQKGLKDKGIMAAAKHFPGHGGTAEDSHDGLAYIDYDQKHLEEIEYEPFRRAISEDVEFVLAGHIIAPNADPSGLPATLSPYFLTDTLRGKLGFKGLIITDAMDMGAIVKNYGSGESSLMAIKAGVDILLIPADYSESLSAVLSAVENGEITEERIDESVLRIISAKLKAGIIE